ncbi:site-2 protease family protein [Botrimarina sp.]|uniref:metalloprotease n=1 Tax=Botrimarina sp. TaxID=2795802 RepID=UPI0032EEC49D
MARIGQYDEPLASPADPLGAPSGWSMPLGVLPIGRWSPFGGSSGVPVRLHVTLAVALSVAIVGCLDIGTYAAWMALAVYAGSLVFHELAHLAAARNLRPAVPPGADPVVLGPIGGLRVARAPSDPRERVFVAMAGPMASLALALIGFASLAVSQLPHGEALVVGGAAELYGLLLHGADPGTPVSATLAQLLIAINLPLFLLNLAPATPFDGGLALRAWLTVWVGPRAAREAAFFVALLLGASLLGAGWAVVLSSGVSPLVGVGLAVIAVIIGFGAWFDASLGRLFPGGGDDQHVGLAESADDLLLRQLLDRPEAAAATDAPETDDAWDDDCVDDILAKVHQGGLTVLTANERAILERASQRYRQRRSC